MKQILKPKNQQKTAEFFSFLVIRSIGLTVLLLLLSLSVRAQNGNDNTISRNNLIGTWLLDYQKSKNKISSEARKMMSQMSQEDKNRTLESYKDLKWFFKEDGTLDVIRGGVRVTTVNWELNAAGTLISVSDSSGKGREFAIKSQRNGALVLNIKSNTAPSMPFLTQWNLKKQ